MIIKKTVKVGNLTLGGSSSANGGNIYIQSMLKKPAADIEGNIRQALELQEAGCDIIRAAVPEKKDAALIYRLKEKVSMPVVADIHFDYKIALEAINAGADKIRLNPGNLEASDRKTVAEICQKRGIPIRIGINAGSLEKEVLREYGLCARALAESALRNAAMLEEIGFSDIVLSVKSSTVKMTIDAYRILHERCTYPLHIGVTEAGTKRIGIIKSAVGIGSLLCDNIGDTIRVSLTAEPLEEIYAAKDLLKAVGFGRTPEVISCPTCGRTEIDVMGLAEEVEKFVSGMNKPLKIAVMGCVVNGSGEAREADIGIAGGGRSANGNKSGVLFKKGEVVGKIEEEKMIEVLKKEIEELL
ncbi:MAG: flavodoxin-dependent (E)-4-hydroxy-3-methylbut-2-enyl-diphosphate synthase [Oscillospiraceae bacterium]|nr:flavodoxin-dependent (E)-4-hydroxy-3-methylbut-2-enyl-diphosphate synthase [Oscillospiraceae bacterium]